MTSNGHPDATVHWSLSGPSCPAGCGTVDASGNFTAPQILPASPAVTITAQSVADSSKQSSATITVTSTFSLQLSPGANITAGNSTIVSATLTPVVGSNPNTVLTWLLSGTGCSGAACGTLSSGATQSLGNGVMQTSMTYQAPSTPPNPGSVTITVTPQADATKKAQATFSIQPVVTVTLSPASFTLTAIHRATLTAQITGTSNTAVSWTVNGISGGNATFGQICVVVSSPCQSAATGAQVDYIASGAIPNPNPVTIQVTSAANPAATSSAQITCA